MCGVRPVTREADPVNQIARELQLAERRHRVAVRRIACVVSAASLGSLLLIAAVVLSMARTTPPPARELRVAEALPPAAPAAPASAQKTVPVPVAEPVVTSPKPEADPEREPAESGRTQSASIDIGEFGYEPSTVQLKAGLPTALRVAQGDGCAAGLLIPELGIAADNSAGSVTVKLPALEPGEYVFTCGMEMVSGTLLVR